MEEHDSEQTRDVDYWRSLVPEATLTDHPFLQGFEPYVVNEDPEVKKEQLRREGYCLTSPIVSTEDLNKLRYIIERVIDAGHRSTYALLYDEFYHVACKLENLMAPILGEGYRLVPDEFEAYYIETSEDAFGAEPHRDSLRSARAFDGTGLPTLINVWIAISDATPLNSTIGVYPAHLDSDYRITSATEDPYNISDTPTPPLEDLRSLPVLAGSAICWSPSLYHWGSRSSSFAKEPRISFAMYFQRGDVPRFHPTTMSLEGRFPFEYRLYLVEKVWRDRPGRELYEVQKRTKMGDFAQGL